MKSIALIVDIKDWAFDIQAKLIKNSLKDFFRIDIFYSKHEPYYDDIVKIIEDVKDYDIVHFFWREQFLKICDLDAQEKITQKNIDLEEMKKKFSTGIYDHSFIGNDAYNQLFNEICKKYVTCSKRLFDIYCKNPKIKDPYMILGDSFDENIFYPKNAGRFKKIKDKLVIGWVGNSSWGNNKVKDKNGKIVDLTGFNTVLNPVIQDLKKEGYNIEINLADKNINFIPNNEMGDFYGKIDIYVCVSITEGTPRPLIEAMGCGVPIITTDIGVAKEYFGEKQKKYIISERKFGESDVKTREELKKRIIYLYNNREKLEELSKENFEMSKSINNSIYSKKYMKYFLDF